MRCILVFDHLNDIIFSKCDRNFVTHINKLGHSQGLDKNEFQQSDDELNFNFIIQLFSPIVTSQRIMTSQFGNSYTSIQCQDGLNMVFDEYIGYLFVHLGFEDIKWLKRMLGICMSVIQHLCGPDISSLKFVNSKSGLVKRLLNTWGTLIQDDQAVLLEALEQLSVSNDLSAVAIKALKDSTDKIKAKLDQSRSHALLFVENKFLALFSSRAARELSAGDLLFLSLLAECTRSEMSTTAVVGASHQKSSTDLSQSSDEFYSPQSSPEQSRKCEDISKSTNGIFTELILLSGNTCPAVIPYIVHITSFAESVSLVLLYQTNYDNLSIALNESLEAVNLINSVSSSSTEVEGLKRGMERLEPAIKKLFDGIKKIKSNEISPKLDANIKVLHVKWDLLKRQWNESISTASIGSCSHSLGLCLRDILQATVLDKSNIERGSSLALSVSHTVSLALADFTSFLQVKALRNFTLGSRASLSINKYLEEFPGLVHFLYIDRTSHRITAPTLDFHSQQTITLTKKKIWEMVEFSRTHLQEGHLAIMWKDTAFNYAYYLWFEDMTGSPLKPKISPAIAVKSLPMPGVFSADFYYRLTETCFPKMALNKIRCYELYCIHLGLASSSCVLEHSRRLAATIWEVTGIPNNPLDLL